MSKSVKRQRTLRTLLAIIPTLVAVSIAHLVFAPRFLVAPDSKRVAVLGAIWFGAVALTQMSYSAARCGFNPTGFKKRCTVSGRLLHQMTLLLLSVVGLTSARVEELANFGLSQRMDYLLAALSWITLIVAWVLLLASTVIFWKGIHEDDDPDWLASLTSTESDTPPEEAPTSSDRDSEQPPR